MRKYIYLKFILLFLIIPSSVQLRAQIHQTLDASGGNATGSGGTESYAVGQLAYMTQAGANGTVAQGVEFIDLFAILPVSLEKFTANCIGSSVLLNWSTASELNSAAFYIEKSSDAVNWIEASTITAAGNSNSIKTYTYTDTKPFPEATYYRLKQTDIDGRFTYSAVVYAGNCGSKSAAIILYPNPAVSGVFVHTENTQGMNYELYDENGRLIRKEKISATPVYIELPGTPSSVYLLKISQNNTVLKTFKILKH